MAHFAELDGSNVVVQVLVVHNDVLDVDGVESEQAGIDFLNGMFPDSGVWKQTSYNRSFRGCYAGPGYLYDADRDAFYYPNSPFPSWVLNETTFDWDPPVPHLPNHVWDEDTIAWVKPPSPFPSWTEWSDDKNMWVAPVAYPGPTDPYRAPLYEWDEDTLTWIEQAAD